MKLILRGHHILCLQGFQGYGYDESFVENMDKINSLRKQNNTKIKVIAEADDICKECPNLKNNICENIEKNNEIISMDEKVISKLPNKSEFDSIFLFNYIKNSFSTPESLNDICENCSWWEKCKFVESISLNSR